MIIVIRPGGTVKDVNVVLRHYELLPNEHNQPRAIVYQESEDNPRDMILVKPLNQVLAHDSLMLSRPEFPPVQDLTFTEEPANLYDHEDIIKFGDDEEDGQ